MTVSRSKILDVLVCATMLCCTVQTAQATQLISIDDPKGDDNGAGALIYPNRGDIQPGDLDLVRISAEQRDDGVWLLNRRDKGWGEFGFKLRDWDELFRRFNVRVTAAGSDDHGPYWSVEPIGGAP